MRAIIFNKSLNYVTNYPKPSFETGWAVVKVLKAGICNTDLEIIKGLLMKFQSSVPDAVSSKMV